MPTTIGRNRRQYVNNIRDAYTECRKYNPESGELEPADAAEAWTMLDHYRDARLIEHEHRAVYTIRHGEDFFELRRPA